MEWTKKTYLVDPLICEVKANLLALNETSNMGLNKKKFMNNGNAIQYTPHFYISYSAYVTL